jgi:starvation-inducible DNA-binding protein
MATTATNAPRQLATPTDISAEGVAKISEHLNGLVADAFALYIRTKNYHWHMSGSHYREYHLLLDEQADAIFATTDVLAERVRRIGGTTIRSVADVARRQKVEDDDRDFVTAYDMLNALIEENKGVTQRMREAHEVCDEYKDVASASLLENFIDESERRVWFLYETIVDGKQTTA